MKQVISIADFATMLGVLNDKIQNVELEAMRVHPYIEENRAREIRKENLKELSKNPVYQSLIHAKKALEECKVEIEVPDLEVEKNGN